MTFAVLAYVGLSMFAVLHADYSTPEVADCCFNVSFLGLN